MTTRITLFILLACTIASFGQAPGNVSSNLHIWLKSNTGVTGSPTVTAWNDQSGNGYNAASPNGPDIITDRVNFNPSLSFNSNYLQVVGGLFGTSTFNDIFVIMVNKTNDVKNSSVFRESTAGGDRFGSHMPWGNERVYYDVGTCCGSSRIQTNWLSGAGLFHIWVMGSSTGTSTPSGTRKSIYRDGLLIGSNNNNDNITGANNTFYMASANGTSSFHEGEISEFIIYTGIPTSAELTRIQSYLAIKYGITLDQTTATNYVSSSGTTVYAATTSHNSYRTTITGIGRDDASALDQQKSRNRSSDEIVTMDKGGSFGSDLSFVVWGSNGDSRLGTTTGAHPSYQYVIERDWKVDLTGSPGTVSVSFDLVGPIPNTGDPSDYALLIDGTDTDYSSGATAHTTGASIANNQITFTGVSFSDGDHFSLAIESLNPTPGGTDNNVLAWYKADAGVTGDPVTQWDDQTNNGFDATSGAGPSVLSNRINYNPSHQFDGSDHMVVSGGLFGSGVQNDMFVYTVSRTNTVTASSIFREELTGGDRFGSHMPFNDNVAYYDFGECCGDGRVSSNWGTSAGNYHLWTLGSSSLSTGPSGTRKFIQRDDNTIVTNDNNSTGLGNSADFYLGSATSTTERFTGEIAEMIIINDSPTASEHNQIRSQLALKYGLQIGIDLLASDGTTVWNSAVAGYQNDIVGIVNETNEGLLQKQSHSEDDSVRIYVGTLAADNNANTSTTGDFGQDKAYIVAGHDGRKLNATTSSAAEMPGAGIYSRLAREWLVSNTNFTGTWNFDVTISAASEPTMVTASDLRLLVDADGDFSDATIYDTGSGLTFSYSSNVITVSGISNTHIAEDADAYITIASASINTPLPIELMNFEAEVIEDEVLLEWRTSFERDNDFFTVQKSTDAKEWLSIDQIAGTNQGEGTKDYSFTDRNPLSGTSYYRLKQTDFDGKWTYSKIKSVQISNALEKLQIYPNPAQNELNLAFSTPEYSQISIYNNMGQLVSEEVVDQELYKKLDLSEFEKGVYILEVRTSESVVSKRFIVN